MNIGSRDLGGGVTRIDLEGRLDIAGAEAVDVPFAGIISTVKSGAVVDLSAVSFIASIGMRSLVQNAKALRLRGANFVLARPTEAVESGLRAAGIHEVVPIFHDLAGPVSAATGPAGAASPQGDVPWRKEG
jgi:anti-sigma B factor antagonist